MKKKDEELLKKIEETADFAVDSMLGNPSAIDELLFFEEDLEKIKAKLSDVEIEDAENCLDNNLDVNPAEKSKEWVAYTQLYRIMQNVNGDVYNAVSGALRKNKLKAMAIMKELENGI